MTNDPNDYFSISTQSINRLVAKLKPQRSTQMKSVIAALFLAQNNNLFRYTNMIGLLQVDCDRKLKTTCLRLYNLQTLKLAFQIQLYYDFANNYKQKDEKFYYFDYPVGTIGLLFRSKEDALIMAAKIKENSPKKQELVQIRKEKMQKQKKQQASKGFFGYINKKIFGKEEQIKQQSQVLTFQVTSKITMDSDGNFIMNGSSPVQKDIEQRLGLSEKEKNDPEIQNMIMENLVIHNMKKQANETANKELINVIQQYEKQENYQMECRKSKVYNLPPPPPLLLPPTMLSPHTNTSNMRVSQTDKRMNLMEQIRKAREGGVKLKHVETKQKGGMQVNLNLEKMDTVERDDFAAALRKKIELRKKALNLSVDSDED